MLLKLGSKSEDVKILQRFLKLKDDNANKFADDPELTISPNFFPKILATVLSSSLTKDSSITTPVAVFCCILESTISSMNGISFFVRTAGVGSLLAFI